VAAVNTHEHIIPEQDRVSQSIDFFTLAGHYAINDVVSAGLAPEALAKINDLALPAEERLADLRTFLENGAIHRLRAGAAHRNS